MQFEDCDPITDHLIVFFEDCHHMKYGTVANDATMATLKVNNPLYDADATTSYKSYQCYSFLGHPLCIRV